MKPRYLLFISLVFGFLLLHAQEAQVPAERDTTANGEILGETVADSLDVFAESDTLDDGKKRKREKKIKPPRVKLPPDSLPRPTLKASVGMMSFYGDVKTNENTNANPLVSNLGFSVGLGQKLTDAFDLNLYFLYGTLSANERSVERNLNFQSKVTAVGANVTYNFNHFLGRSRKVTPYLSLGIESFEFRSKADLVDEYGNEYHYWSDGSIHNLPEDDPNADQSILIQRDYTYESDLRSRNYDGTGNFPERSIAIPIGAGVEFELSSKIRFGIGTSYHITFTDFIDNVTESSSGERIGSRAGNKKNDRFLYTNASLSINFTRSVTGKVELEDEWGPQELMAFGDEDYDGDGILDFVDDCPGTPPGVEVDERGCPLNPPQPTPMTDEEIYQNYLAYMDSTGLYAKIERSAFSSENPKVFGAFVKKPVKKYKKSFKIKLGEFVGGVPADVQNQMLSMPDVETHVKGNKTIFTAGSYETLPDAIKRKIEAAKEGFEDAEIVMQDSNGDIISLGDESGNLDLDASSFEPQYESPYVFRVQLGAFKKKKPDDAFRNVQNLVVVENEGGYTKYMSGAFNDYASAAQHKVDMIVEGWKGAFVVAYQRGQGKRVTMDAAGVTEKEAAEARKLIESGKIATGETENIEPPSETFDKSRIKFKIQIGIYKNDVPSDVLSKYMRLNNLEQLAVDSSDFATRYTSGEFETYESAVNYRNKLIQKGFKTAFIIALKDGQLISIDEARRLLGEKLD